MQAFEDALKLELTAAQVRGGRESFEIVRIERRLVGAQESVVRVTPRATSVALAAVFKMIHLNHARAGSRNRHY